MLILGKVYEREASLPKNTDYFDWRVCLEYSDVNPEEDTLTCPPIDFDFCGLLANA